MPYGVMKVLLCCLSSKSRSYSLPLAFCVNKAS